MRKNILFIDDDSAVLNGYEKLFKNPKSNHVSDIEELLGIEEKIHDEDYVLYFASQGEKGIEIVKERVEEQDPISLAFIDMRMPPGLDGGETAKQLSLIDPLLEMVIVTAYSDKDLEKVSEELGRSDKLLFLKKPFDSIEIKQLARNLCEKRNLERVKENFLAHVSHELSTPLVSIVGFLDILSMSENIVSEDKEAVDIAHRNSLILKELVEDLLTSAKWRQKDIEVDWKEFDLRELLNDAKLAVKHWMKGKEHIKFIIDVDDKMGKVYGSPLLLKKVFINLLSNAFKYTQQGFVKAKIQKNDQKLSIFCEDSGRGIPKEFQEKVFREFYRVDKKMTDELGLGLGLSIIKKIVEAHGGSIELNSEIDKGTVFHITIPQDNLEGNL